MKNIILFMCLGAIGLPLFSCKSTQYKAENLPAQQLRWGNGGGYTGVETTFSILENGQIFKKEGLNAGFSELSDIKKGKAAKLFKQSLSLDLNAAKDLKPSNIYQFLELADGKGGFQRIAFDASKLSADSPIASLYNALTGILGK